MRIVDIPREHIVPGPWQPRSRFEDAVIKELAESIATHGVLTALRVAATEAPDQYRLIAGERRWRAAAIAGLATLPCIVLDADEAAKASTQALVDNLHREDLTPLEEARALARLREEQKLSERKLARLTGKSQSWVNQRLALLALPPSAVAALDSGGITYDEARHLRKLSDFPEYQEALIADLGKQEPKATRKALDDKTFWAAPDLTRRVDSLIAHRQRAIEKRTRIEEARRQLTEAGRTALDTCPGWDDKAFTRLTDGTLDATLHDDGRLTCEAYAISEHGQVHRYCTDPTALRKAKRAARKSGEGLTEWDLEERNRKLRRRVQLDVLRAYFEATPDAAIPTLAMLLRHDMRAELRHAYRPAPALELCKWLDLPGDNTQRIRALLASLDELSDTEVLRRWTILQCLESIAYSHAPDPELLQWLAQHGYHDPAQLADGSSADAPAAQNAAPDPVEE